MDSVQKLQTLLNAGLLAGRNRERIARVFCDATKIVYARQKRFKKPQLKMKEFSSTIVLAESLHSNAFHFEAVGSMAENFGGEFSEQSALEYFSAKVMGEVKDKHNRSIMIDEDAMKSLYKEPLSGKHIVASENYEQMRGKRLPWIRHVLTSSESIYLNEESGSVFRRTFVYTAIVSIPLIGSKPKTEYYVVPVREGKNGRLRMVTAYSMSSRNDFLRVLAPCKLHVHVQANKDVTGG